MNLHKNPQSKHRSPKTKLVLGEEREWSRAENVLIMHAVGAARIRRDNDAHVCNEQAQPVCSTTKRSGDFDTYRFIHDQRTLVGWLVGWLAGWLAGWLVGWLDGAKSSSKQIGGAALRVFEY